MYIVHTKHLLDKLKSRRWLVWKKAELYIDNLFRDMIETCEPIRWENGSLVLKRWKYKIVYKKISKLEYKLITYAEHKEIDHIEYWLMKILRCT